MGRRTWIKIYSSGWLRGSIRKESYPIRCVFIDLLAMAGDSAYGDEGIIQLADGVGFTDELIAVILNIPLNIWLKAKDRLSNHPKLSENRVKISFLKFGFAVKIVNWKKYQSEYQRQKEYRKKYKRNYEKSKQNNKSYIHSYKEKETEIEKDINNKTEINSSNENSSIKELRTNKPTHISKLTPETFKAMPSHIKQLLTSKVSKEYLDRVLNREKG